MKLPTRFENFPPYTPIEPFEVLARRLGRSAIEMVKLDANENPYGPSPLVRRALAELSFTEIYPDPQNLLLREGLADFYGVPLEQVMAGSGADELIDLLLRVILEPGDMVLTCPPTFGMYAFDTRLNHGQVIEVPRRADFSLDLPAIEAAVRRWKPACLFIAAPNNPDGGLPEREELEKLLSLPVLVVVDEAYIEFTDGSGHLGEARSLSVEAAKRDNLVVLRTFSKWAGLAGLRVGWGVFPAWLIGALWKAKQPYNVNRAASTAALASLQDAALLAERVEKIRAERARLASLLEKISYLAPYPSQGNFILCRVLGMPGGLLKKLLEDQGILVRHYDTPLLKNYIRISVGLPLSTDRLLGALESIGGMSLQQIASRMGEVPTPAADSPTAAVPWVSRTAQIRRITRETKIEVDLGLDGSGKTDISTGISFLDHMLQQVAVHGLFDLSLKAQGDLEVDAHHTVEDTALALGQAFSEALGERRGIVRMGSAACPMDESLATVAVDFSGRPYAVVQVEWAAEVIGGQPASLLTHFLESFASAARCNLHAAVAYGRDGHHQAEAIFKALGRALDAAVRIEKRRSQAVPSSKGVIS